MTYIETVLRAAGEEDEDVLRDLLQDSYSQAELTDYLSGAIRSKIHRDGISGELEEEDINRSCSISSKDNPLDFSEYDEGRMTTVRRYISLPQFASLLHSGLWFSRTDVFSDKFEGRRPEEAIRQRYNNWEYLEMEDDPPPYDLLDMYQARDKILRKQSFVSSWRYGGDESQVFWDAYVDDQPGVAIETSLENLQSELQGGNHTVAIGKIEYRQYRGTRESLEGDSVKRFFYKRNGFEDEQELRLLARKQINDYTVEKDSGKNFDISIDADSGFKIGVDPDSLIDKIILPPDANDREILEVVSLADHHGLDAEIWKSRLDVSPRKTAPVRVTGENEGKVTDENLAGERRIDKSNYRN